MKPAILKIFLISLFLVHAIGSPMLLFAHQEQRLFSMDSVTIDIVMSRFYFLQRLLPAIRLLKKQRPKKSFFAKCKRQNIYTALPLKNEHIIHMVNDMQEQKSIHPLLCTWQGLHCYKYIKDTTIMKEFALVLVLILNSLYRHGAVTQDITKSKDSLEELSLEEILMMLDFLLEEIPEFVDSYELNSSITWNEWLKKYWLVAPVAAAILCIRLYALYKKSIETEGHLLQQSPSQFFM